LEMSIEKRAEFLISDALSLKATDIHISPKGGSASIHYRISGKLVQRFSLPPTEAEKLISHLKFQAGMDIGEKRRPQNGSSVQKVIGRIIDLRLSTLPSLEWESLVIRLLPRHEQGSLQRLTLFPKSRDVLLSIIRKPYGLLILTGPTGSGKTTTLYTLLRESVQTDQRKVITLEDPIEKRDENLLQIQINERAGITYATGLKAILRHDPDIIVIGEIRDAETARIAIRASMTGHLVLSTMHTKNAKGALYRLLEFGISPLEMEESLLAVTAQRLVELTCPYCEGNCSPFCDRGRDNRSAVFEILHGRGLKEALLEMRGAGRISSCRSLKQMIAKGISLGFIRETEYERWVSDFEEDDMVTS
jgi:Type II/IV secretion system protein.